MSLLDLLQARLSGGAQIQSQLDEEDYQRRLEEAKKKAQKLAEIKKSQEVAKAVQPTMSPTPGVGKPIGPGGLTPQQKAGIAAQEQFYKEHEQEYKDYNKSREQLYADPSVAKQVFEQQNAGVKDEDIRVNAGTNFEQIKKDREKQAKLDAAVENANKAAEEADKAQQKVNILKGVGTVVSPVGSLIDTFKNDVPPLAKKLEEKITAFKNNKGPALQDYMETFDKAQPKEKLGIINRDMRKFGNWALSKREAIGDFMTGQTNLMPYETPEQQDIQNKMEEINVQLHALTEKTGKINQLTLGLAGKDNLSDEERAKFKDLVRQHAELNAALLKAPATEEYKKIAQQNQTNMALSWMPIGGLENTVKSIVATTTKGAAKKLISQLGKNYSDDLAAKLINANTTEDAMKLLRNITLPKTSKEMYFNFAKKAYNAERTALHNKIINNVFKDKPTVEVPTFRVVTGHSASGKSTLADNILAKEHPDAVFVDPDKFKTMLPEKQGPWLHDESSDIAQNILKKAIDEKKDVIFVGNVKNTQKYRDILDGAKKNGYEFDINAVQTDKQTALKRNLKRSMNKQSVPVIEALNSYNSYKSGVDLLKKYGEPKVFNGTEDFAAQFGKFNKKGTIEGDLEKITSAAQEHLPYESKRYFMGLQGKALEKFEKTGKIPRAEQAFGGEFSITDDYGLAKQYSGDAGKVIEIKPKKNIEIGQSSMDEGLMHDISDIGDGEYLVSGNNAIDIVKNKTENVIQKGMARSKVMESAEKNQFISQDIKQQLEGRGFYNIRDTKDLIIKSRNLVNDFPDIAERVFNTRSDDTAIAIGEELVKKFSDTGQGERALQIIEQLSQKGKGAGRGVQIFSAFGKLSPEDVGRFAQRQLDIANELNPKLHLKLGEAQYNKFYEAAKALQKMPESYDKQVATALLMKDIYSMIPSTGVKKIGLLQTMAQLLNPKTIIRNIGGNTMFAGIENVSQTIGAPVDKFLSLFTKNRTVALPRPITQLKSFGRGLVRGAKESWMGINVGPQTQFDLPQTQVFKDKILGSLEKVMGVVLKGPDRAAYSAAFDDTVKGLLKANKLEKATPEILELAHYNGLYRTFQDNSMAAKFFMGTKKNLNYIGIKAPNGDRFGLGDFLVKYPKTPGNIIARGFDYTPTGFLKTISEAAKPLFGKPFDQQKFVMSFSRAITGSTGLVGLGYTMHKLGIITGSPSKDKDVNAFNQMSGSGAYKINASAMKRFVMSGFDKDSAKTREGDTMISYDWAQPMAIPISLGAKISENNKGMSFKQINSYADVITGSIEQGISTLQEQPMMTGIRRLFGSGGGLMAGLEATAEGTLSSFVPTLAKQINQYFDNTSRETYDPNTINQIWNLTKVKIPFLSQTLPIKTDVFGKDKENYQNGTNGIFNVFLNPAFVSKLEETPESKMVMDIYTQSGETKQFPRVAPRSIELGGETRDLQADEYVKLQKYTGEATFRLFSTLAVDKGFQALSPEEKANQLSTIMTDIGKAAKHNLFGEDNGAKTIDELIVKQEKISGFRGVEALVKSKKIDQVYDLIDSMSKDDQKMFTEFKMYNDTLKGLNPYTRYDDPNSTAQKAENTRTLKERLYSDHPEEGMRFFKKLPQEEQDRILKNMDNKGNEELYQKFNEFKDTAPSDAAGNTPTSKPYILGGQSNATDELLRKKKIADAFEPYVYGDVNPRITENTIDREARNYMYDQYPFTDEVKAQLDKKMAIDVNGELSSRQAGGEYYQSQTENDKMKMSTDQGVGTNRIYANSGPETAAHEALHSYFMESGLEKNKATTGEFNSIWENEKKNNKQLQNIDDRMKDSGLYKNDSADRLANERFAYLGGDLGKGGIDAFPEKLKPFYEKVFKKSDMPVDERKKLIDEADKISTMVDNEEIPESEGSKKLDEIDKRLRQLSFSDYLKNKGY